MCAMHCWIFQQTFLVVVSWKKDQLARFWGSFSYSLWYVIAIASCSAENGISCTSISCVWPLCVERQICIGLVVIVKLSHAVICA